MCMLRRFIIIIIILLLPFMVNAEECNQNSIKIQSIAIKDKSKYTEELSKTTFENNKINLDLKMYDVGDYIEYELKVKNDSDEKYFFDEKSLNINSNYFDYSLSYKDNSNKIEPNTEKTIYLKVQYKKEVEKENFFSGKYKDNNIVSLLLTDNKKSILSNPLTGSNKIILLLISMIILGIYLYYKKTNNLKLNIFILFGLSLLIPISTYALCEVKLDINSNITIGKVKPNPCTYDGELVQGAEYVNGQYTYRYMQERNGSDWKNIENDGWGVILTDKESTDDVNTMLCTSINDKPIVSMSDMFLYSKTRNIDLSSFDTSNVTNMGRMFYIASDVENIDISSFDTSKVENMSYMFSALYKLKTIDLSSFDTKNLKSLESIFYNDKYLEEVNMDNWNLELVEMFSGWINECQNLKKMSLKNWKIHNILPIFNYASNLEIIDVTGWDTSNVTNFSYLFAYCRNLYNIEGITTWDTGSALDMSNMFNDCRKIKSLDLSNFNTENVSSFYEMFLNCTSLETLNLDNWNLNNIIYNQYMFMNTNSLKTISAKNWKIGNIAPQSVFYSNGSAIETIDVTGWNLSNTTVLYNTFNYSISLKKIIGLNSWDTSNILDMNHLFYISSVQELDLSSWDTSKVTNMNSMFDNSNNLKTIYVGDKFNTNSVTDSGGMFSNTPLLVGGNGTTYDSNHVDKEYARIDEPGKPGYFTRK